MSFNKETVGDLIIADRMLQLADKRISAEKRAEILARPKPRTAVRLPWPPAQ